MLVEHWSKIRQFTNDRNTTHYKVPTVPGVYLTTLTGGLLGKRDDPVPPSGPCGMSSGDVRSGLRGGLGM